MHKEQNWRRFRWGCITEQKTDFQKSPRLNFHEAIYVIGNYEWGEEVVKANWGVEWGSSGNAYRMIQHQQIHTIELKKIVSLFFIEWVLFFNFYVQILISVMRPDRTHSPKNLSIFFFTHLESYKKWYFNHHAKWNKFSR